MYSVVPLAATTHELRKQLHEGAALRRIGRLATLDLNNDLWLLAAHYG